jgi:hypothetical protein
MPFAILKQTFPASGTSVFVWIDYRIYPIMIASEEPCGPSLPCAFEYRA